jgi:integrase/recombinase XerD
MGQDVCVMITLRLRYLSQDLDRHGNLRYYVRVGGRRKVRIRGLFGTEEFMAAYNSAVSGILTSKKALRYGSPKGSFGHTCLLYYASAEFTRLDRSTRSWRRRALDRICENYANDPIIGMKPKHVRRLRDELANKPGASRNRLKALKALFHWAVESGVVEDDPTRDIKPISYLTKGHHTWSSQEIDAFERQHPIGTQARLAMALMLFTACRVEDVVRLGPQHIHDGWLQYTQAKNEHRKPVRIDIPVFSDLAAIIRQTPSGNMTFLVTQYGRPFTVKGFSNKFKDWCREAGLPHCASHGLRKTCATRLAESGATEQEIMAILGHQTTEQVTRYTKAVNKKLLASSGMSKLKKRT